MSQFSLANLDLDHDKKISKNNILSNTLLIPTKKNPIKINPDSPRTCDACNELGLEPDYFKLK